MYKRKNFDYRHKDTDIGGMSDQYGEGGKQ